MFSRKDETMYESNKQTNKSNRIKTQGTEPLKFRIGSVLTGLKPKETDEKEYKIFFEMFSL
jgi:hypothetical protein